MGHKRSVEKTREMQKVVKQFEWMECDDEPTRADDVRKENHT